MNFSFPRPARTSINSLLRVAITSIGEESTSRSPPFRVCTWRTPLNGLYSIPRKRIVFCHLPSWRTHLVFSGASEIPKLGESAKLNGRSEATSPSSAYNIHFRSPLSWDHASSATMDRIGDIGDPCAKDIAASSPPTQVLFSTFCTQGSKSSHIGRWWRQVFSFLSLISFLYSSLWPHGADGFPECHIFIMASHCRGTPRLSRILITGVIFTLSKNPFISNSRRYRALKKSWSIMARHAVPTPFPGWKACWYLDIVGCRNHTRRAFAMWSTTLQAGLGHPIGLSFPFAFST